MQNRGYLIIGGALVILGLSVLVSELTGFNLCAVWLPLLLIGIGLLILFRPRMARTGTEVTIQPLGDVKRKGQWIVADEEIWLFVGDLILDLTEAVLPLDEVTIRAYGFVSGIKLIVPEGVGVAVSSTAFLTTTRIFDHKRDTFLAPYTETTPEYETAAKKVRIEPLYFVTEVKVRHAPS